MESSKFKSNYQTALRSFFSFTKKLTLSRNLKQIVLFTLNSFFNYLEYVIFQCNIFLFSLKKKYLFGLVNFTEITNYFFTNSIELIFKKIKNSRNNISLFFNIPLILSVLISEIFESIKRKTIYLYRLVLFLSIPVLIFCVNQTFVSQKEKDSLSFLLPENKKFFSSEQNQQIQKNFLYIKNWRKKNFHDHTINFLFQKIKNFPLPKQEDAWLVDQKISYVSFLSNISKEKPFLVPFSFSTHSYTKINQLFVSNKFSFLDFLKINKISNIGKKAIDKKRIIFSKWFYLYLKLKKTYLTPFSFWNSLKQIEKKNEKNFLLTQSTSSYKFQNYSNPCQLFSENTLEINTKNFFKKDFLQTIDHFFFSLIQPYNLYFLNNLPLTIFSNRDSLNLDLLKYDHSVEINVKNGYEKLIPIKKNTKFPLENQKTSTRLFFELINKKQWMVIIREWINMYSSSGKLASFSTQKHQIKEIFYSFKERKNLFPFLKKSFSYWTPQAQIYVGNSVFKRFTLSSLFINKQRPFVFRSYKNALQRPVTNAEILSYKNSDILLFLSPKTNWASNARVLFSLQKINFLYNFLFPFTNNDIVIKPELFFFIFNQLKNPSLVFEKGFLGPLNPNENNGFLYDFDFYFNNLNPNDDFFWLPNSLLQKTILEEKKKKLTSVVPKSNLISFHQDLKIMKKKRENIHNNLYFQQTSFFKKYSEWFFTPQWWLFRQNGVVTEVQLILEHLNNITQIAIQNLFRNLGFQKNKNFLYYDQWKTIPTIFGFQIQDLNKLLVDRFYTKSPEKSFWINVNLIPSVNNNFWSFFAWFLPSSVVYYHWVPMLTGVIYFFLWLDFEKIRSLSYPSWKTFLNILTHNSLDSSSQQVRLVGYLSRGKIFSIYSKFYKLYSRLFFVFNKINYITTVDLSRRNKNLVSNSLITKKTLELNYNLWNINQENYHVLVNTKGSINGFSFFQKWSEKHRRIESILALRNSFSSNWLNDLLFYNNNLISFLQGRSSTRDRNWKSKPTSLSEPLLYTRRWLFIGSLETGKTYIIKNISASTHYPLIHISIQDIKNATPDSKYTKLKKQKRWIEQLSERSFFLDNILNLAKILSPSFFWVSDLHDFDTKNHIQERNTQKFDISLLLASLLKILSSDLVAEGKNYITFIGSTQYPRLLDPKFVSRQRLDLIVNFRTPSFNQRQSIFSTILKTKGFPIKGLRFFYEFSSNTLGYTFRDITSLVNETLLVKTTENTTLVDSDAIRLALYRQTSTQSVKYKTIKQENFQYKIGKALIQTILLYPKSIILLSKYHDLWKTKFYYLSNTYLDISSKKAITTEFVLLSHILNCLAGSAARDAWVFSTNFFSEGVQIPLSLTSQLKHDFSIASNILQSLLVEFSMQDITSLTTQKKKSRKDILESFQFNFLKRAVSYLEFLDQFPSYINWSIKAKRLSFNWILFFNGIEHSTKNLARLLVSDKNKKNSLSPLLSQQSDLNIPYERRETKRQLQKIKKIDSFFNKLVYTMYMENLGFPWDSNFGMDYNPFQFSLFFREARPLWNPQTIMPSYSVLFFDRDLLINQKLLTKLYITYGNKFQIEKLNRKRIKKQILSSNYSLNKGDDNKNSERKNEVVNYQTFPNGTISSDFYFYQNLINLNAQLDQSQIQLPVYLHQGWITADPNETYRVFDILATKNVINNDQLITKESFLFEILLEVYHYLINFFIKNKNILIEVNEILMKKEILYRKDLEILIKKYS